MHTNNLGMVFRRTLRDNTRTIFWMGVGLGALAFFVALIYPAISGLEEINDLFSSPLFGSIIPGIEGLDFTSPEGFIGIEFYTWTPIVLAVFAVTFGLSVIGSEEARGTMDLLMSTPLPRWQLIIEKTAAYLVIIVAILALAGLGLILGVMFVPDMDLAPGRIIEGQISTLPVMLLIMALALFLTTVLRRSLAGGLAAAFIVASYFINSFAEVAESDLLNALQNLSFYNYYRTSRLLIDGINWGHFAILTAVALILLGLSLFFFERRDLQAT